jgi:RNA polymerase sigma-70 factor (ECF subfamily)
MSSKDDSANDLPSTFLRNLVDRLQSGDGTASDELLRHIGNRMDGLARRMLRRFPAVKRYEQTADVVQGATIRLLRALRAVRPATTREFFGLAAEQVRRELIDLTRHYYGPEGWGANHESNLRLQESSGPLAVRCEPEAPGDAPEDLERWTAFHEAVAHLPPEEREVFGLKFYHGWGQKEIGELLEKDERTVRRKWRRACMLLNDLLKGELPPGTEM